MPEARATTFQDPLQDFDGEWTSENWHRLLNRVREQEYELARLRGVIEELELANRKQEQELNGKRVQIAKLEMSEEERLFDAPEAQVVELLHALHAHATRVAHEADKKAGAEDPRPQRKKRLDATERKQAGVCVKKLGFRICLAAVFGITYDPGWSPPRRNGSKECFNYFELALRNTQKAVSYAERVPNGWEPAPDKIAEVGKVEVEWVEALLSAKKGKVPLRRGIKRDEEAPERKKPPEGPDAGA